MKRLARHRWVDVEFRSEKQLMILICEGPYYAKEFLEFLRYQPYHFGNRPSKGGSFELSVAAMTYGDVAVNIDRSHRSFKHLKDFDSGKITQVTTGYIMANNRLAYMKETFAIQRDLSVAVKRRVSKKKENKKASKGFISGNVIKLKEVLGTLFSR
ncbi:hypothetical protein [Daejeonella sp.]|uniref:hypothetical protein n=1 Tax=Daejeonella sp. TaxID=2805397 RepID=UPI0030C5A24C